MPPSVHLVLMIAFAAWLPFAPRLEPGPVIYATPTAFAMYSPDPEADAWVLVYRNPTKAPINTVPAELNRQGLVRVRGRETSWQRAWFHPKSDTPQLYIQLVTRSAGGRRKQRRAHEGGTWQAPRGGHHESLARDSTRVTPCG